jgi:UDP-N-acetylglucosamine--N-acetylmuramyl-(pentapeptide) pyrophosphoryl-undecaprenol N-acetylglucosamine transferase
VIGWYIHHHGRGHLTRALAVQPHLTEPVVALSSLAPPAGCGFTDWITLDRDDVPTPTSNCDANGRLHWAPLRHSGLARRNAAITQWIARERPRALVVDVSVEVAVLARLSGVPVIVVAGPGDRGDKPHQLCYDVAEHIIAAWPQRVYDPAFLHWHLHKTSYVGAFSRFDDFRPAAADDAAVVVLNGAGGSGLTEADIRSAQQAVPRFSWTALGLPGQPWVDDVWPRLSSAAVIVSHGGQNAVAESAAAARPTVIIAQDRPFGEQHAVAAALNADGIALGLEAWPSAQEWPDVIDRALALGGSGWSRWASGTGAARAAGIITRTAATP